MLNPYPSRLRSRSSPVRPGGSPRPSEVTPGLGPASSIESIEEGPEQHPNWRPAPSSPAAASNTRRVFRRLKRPSSAAMDRGYTSDVRGSATPGPSQTTYKRPSIRPNSRPSTSSGIPDCSSRARSSSSASESLRDTSLFKGFGPIMGAGADFVLSRKKSRSSKSAKSAYAIPKVKEDPVAETLFSTPDRTILEELKKKMKARDDQFTLKNGKRHHPYPADEVPYPRSYERHVVDSDIWECMWHSDVCGKQIWHLRTEPPSKVLDLGCGSGSWILDCAMHWKDAEFVGLDVVPLHPDLGQSGSSQLASRITWIQANFLEGLPFQNEEFDFVHGKRIARGVPEDKWDTLLEASEVHRVLKPGGVFELFEEELTFPGKLLKGKPPDTIDLPTCLSSSNLTFPEDPRNSGSSNNLTIPSNPSTPPPPRKTQRPRNDSGFGGSVLSLGMMSPQALPAIPLPVSPPQSREPELTDQELLEAVIIGRSKPKPVFDPRDHSLLEFIYNEMHAERFINLEPLALLQNSLSLIFDHVSTHPPLIMTFPPRPASYHHSKMPTAQQSPTQKLSVLGFPVQEVEPQMIMTLEDAAKGATPYVMFDDSRAKPSFRPRRPSRVSSPASPGDDPGYPSHLSLPRALSAASLAAMHAARDITPLAAMTCDLRTLNMHLALRVREILACAEEMWRFVLAYQERHIGADATVRGRGAAARRAFDEDLAQLHREEFDEMLVRFRLDMEDSILLAQAVHARLGWPLVRAPVPPERLEFEELCAVWAKHQGTASAEASPDGASRRSHAGSRASNASASTDAPPSVVLSAGRREDAATLVSVEPHERMSRTVRTFVAWKAVSSDAPNLKLDARVPITVIRGPWLEATTTPEMAYPNCWPLPVQVAGLRSLSPLTPLLWPKQRAHDEYRHRGPHRLDQRAKRVRRRRDAFAAVCPPATRLPRQLSQPGVSFWAPRRHDEQGRTFVECFPAALAVLRGRHRRRRAREGVSFALCSGDSHVCAARRRDQHPGQSWALENPLNTNSVNTAAEPVSPITKGQRWVLPRAAGPKASLLDVHFIRLRKTTTARRTSGQTCRRAPGIPPPQRRGGLAQFTRRDWNEKLAFADVRY
ncbi:hypothetical protein PHLGIDRAFT_36807 [Phlebiopsis gigantea 11061_1 CR5-6]|uniref:Methyltransferase domain-containing protein n=1 Tax=Phlebiopsis gigantea (strain 11061_1 CR5-6) TaxID=745531 RepID=A0A0C3S3X3_PHLG1|nr:hypothetical protein PHLGIDRAFT_36807 [Phlebiopsis gigantea 11061_1 CR5-6]